MVYTAYAVGDTISVSGEQYYVIANSPIADDYVVALKVTSLTRSEVYCVDPPHGVGCGEFDVLYFGFGTGVSYDTSSIKTILESWASNEFTDELKTVDGYSTRLIKFDELTSNLGYEYFEQGTSSGYRKTESTPSWVYNSRYWTMSQYSDSSSRVWRVFSDGNVSYGDVSDNNGGAVRPVINVYKSAITQSQS